MTDSDALTALAARVEALTGPDRDVDAEIAALVGLRIVQEGHPFGRVCYDDKHQAIVLPSYTRSLDAAMTLLDKFGVLLDLSDIGADGLPLARVGRPDLDDVPVFTGISSGIAVNATPTSGLALALCAAALRARARQATSAAIGGGSLPQQEGTHDAVA